MFDALFSNSTIKAIATELPKKLIKAYGKKEVYSVVDINTIYLSTFETNLDIHYAYAMFCTVDEFAKSTQQDGVELSYNELRCEIAKYLFDGWPRFNFESLLNLDKKSPLPDLVNEVTDIGLDLLGGS
ncbi:DUF6559 family protein [Thalassotalea ganghwensis]